MIPALPPLQALRAFEAAARHLSYTNAAAELRLTHGAISHHVARLEAELGGVRLFVRDGQRMRLTEAGQDLVIDLRRGLRFLAEAMERAGGAPKGVSRCGLSVSVLPSFAARWLVPRLSGFLEAHGNVDVAIHPRSTLATLDRRDRIDLAIRYGPGGWPGLQASLLMPSLLSPVCSPEFRARTGIEAAEDLQRVTLLRNRRQPWRPWFQAAGLEASEPDRGPIFDDGDLPLRAAAAGQGVALARLVLAAEDIAAGRLVRLSEITAEDDYSWFVVWRDPVRCDRAAFDAFRGWLDREAGAPLSNDPPRRVTRR